jgi:hypothetical protein
LAETRDAADGLHLDRRVPLRLEQVHVARHGEVKTAKDGTLFCKQSA